MRLTILFDTPYWVGVLEIERDGLLSVARHIFGADPSEQEVYEFVQRDLLKLQDRMTVGVPVDGAEHRHINPKRLQREIKRDLAIGRCLPKRRKSCAYRSSSTSANRHTKTAHSGTHSKSISAIWRG